MNNRLYQILLVAYMILILSVSSIPQDSLPKVFLLTWDKLLHLVEYFILGILAVKSMNDVTFRSILIVVLFGTVFGMMDEYLQSYISGRMSSGYDVVADTIGVTIGALLVLGKNKKT